MECIRVYILWSVKPMRLVKTETKKVQRNVTTQKSKVTIQGKGADKVFIPVTQRKASELIDVFFLYNHKTLNKTLLSVHYQSNSMLNIYHKP